jgi:MFS family permease
MHISAAATAHRLAANDTESCEPVIAMSTFRRWASLSILLILSILAFIDRSILALMVTPIKTSLGLSDFQVGLIEGLAFSSFYALCAIPIGRALDRHAKNPIIYLGIAIWSLASAACGLAQNFTHLLLARFSVGSGEAVLTPASYAIISRMFPKERLSTALSIFSIGGSIGAAIAMLVGAFAISFASRHELLPVVGAVDAWRLVFLVTGLPGLLFGLMIFLVPEFRSARSRPTLVSHDQALRFMQTRAPFLICHFLGFPLLALLASATVGWLPTFLIRHHGWNGGQAGAAMAVVVLALTTGVLFGGVVVDALLRRGIKDAPMRYQSVMTIVATVCGVSAFLVSSVWLTLALMAIALVGCAMGGVAAAALQTVTPPELRSQMSATYLVFISIIGTGGGPLIVAVMTDFVFRSEAMVGYSIAATYACVGPLAFLCFLFGRRHMVVAISLAEGEYGETLI